MVLLYRTHESLFKRMIMNMMVYGGGGGGGVRGGDGGGDGDNDDGNDDDDDGTETGTLEVKRGIKLKSARTWLWSFKGYEELT